MKPASAKHSPSSLSDAAWAVALRYETFGYAEVSADLRIGMKKAAQIVRGWEADGAVIVVSTASHGPGRKKFRADRDFVRLPGRTAEENLWAAMRRLRSFTPSTISAHATTEQIAVPPEAAAAYCRTLLAADYLTVTRRAAPAMKREAIYRLARETGPKAPVPARVRALRDPNLDQVIVLETGR